MKEDIIRPNICPLRFRNLKQDVRNCFHGFLRKEERSKRLLISYKKKGGVRNPIG